MHEGRNDPTGQSGSLMYKGICCSCSAACAFAQIPPIYVHPIGSCSANPNPSKKAFRIMRNPHWIRNPLERRAAHDGWGEEVSLCASPAPAIDWPSPGSDRPGSSHHFGPHILGTGITCRHCFVFGGCGLKFTPMLNCCKICRGQHVSLLLTRFEFPHLRSGHLCRQR